MKKVSVWQQQEQQRVAVGPGNAYLISICQVSSNTATLQVPALLYGGAAPNHNPDLDLDPDSNPRPDPDSDPDPSPDPDPDPILTLTLTLNLTLASSHITLRIVFDSTRRGRAYPSSPWPMAYRNMASCYLSRLYRYGMASDFSSRHTVMVRVGAVRYRKDPRVRVRVRTQVAMADWNVRDRVRVRITANRRPTLNDSDIY